jgi:hypothetical protein
LSTTGAFTQDQARAIVEKAIQARGGDANVAKLRTMRIKVEGTTALIPGQPDLPFTIEDTWQMPKRYKTRSTFQQMGRRVTLTEILEPTPLPDGWTGFELATPEAALGNPDRGWAYLRTALGLRSEGWRISQNG